MFYEEKYYTYDVETPIVINSKNKKKNSLIKLYKNCIRNYKYTDLEVIIGDFIFSCHKLALQGYCEYFRNLPNDKKQVVLPERIVGAHVFPKIYDWILADKATVEMEGIVELYMAAKFLGITEMLQQCSALLDDPQTTEVNAFFLYLAARNFQQYEIQHLMMKRIVKFFLIVVASKNFVTFSLPEVVELLSQNSIGVHSEIEVLFAGIRWLKYDWDNRIPHFLEIINCVRFNLFSPNQLVQLNIERNRGDGPEINKNSISSLLYDSRVHKVVRATITFITALYTKHRNGPNSISDELMARLSIPCAVPRVWLKDQDNPDYLKLSNLEELYEEFLNYLESLKVARTDNFESFTFVKYPPYCEHLEIFERQWS